MVKWDIESNDDEENGKCLRAVLQGKIDSEILIFVDFQDARQEEETVSNEEPVSKNSEENLPN